MSSTDSIAVALFYGNPFFFDEARPIRSAFFAAAETIKKPRHGDPAYQV